MSSDEATIHEELPRDEEAPRDSFLSEALPQPVEESAGPPPRIWEFATLILFVLVADQTVYLGHGFAGAAALFAAVPILLMIGAVDRRLNGGTWTLFAALMLLSVRLVWCGSTGAVLAGLYLTAGLAISLSGGPAWTLQISQFFTLLPTGAIRAWQVYEHHVRQFVKHWIGFNVSTVILAWVLPIGTGLVFITLFVFANPDLANWISRELHVALRDLELWFSELIGSPLRVLCWALTLAAGAGLLRPLLPQRVETPVQSPDSGEVASPLYIPFRNTIFVVVAVFAGYLLFEFSTMWFREFPPGFYYSGYAHEGAAWLTTALAIATLILSAIFRGSFLRDPRMPALRRVAMFWVFENVLLALSVYQRLYIYIAYNGMTQMRVVGALGIGTVVAGLGLVVWKLWCGHDFHWLLRRQMTALFVAVYLYLVFPVDYCVMGWNTRQILAGNPRPSVQIIMHGTSDEGMLAWLPLLNCDDPVIRAGVVELLRNRAEKAKTQAGLRTRWGWSAWTAHQIAEERLAAGLGSWDEFTSDHAANPKAREDFLAYAFQWW